jgi:hypothetical protein
MILHLSSSAYLPSAPYVVTALLCASNSLVRDHLHENKLMPDGKERGRAEQTGEVRTSKWRNKRSLRASYSVQKKKEGSNGTLNF